MELRLNNKCCRGWMAGRCGEHDETNSVGNSCKKVGVKETGSK